MKTIKNIVLLLFATTVLYAQGGGSSGLADARSTAMGKTYTASSRGVFTFGINPANLVMPAEKDFEISIGFPLPNFNFGIGNDFMTMDNFNYFFGGVQENGQTVGRLLTDQDKEDFLNLFSDGSEIKTGFNLNLISLSYNAGKEIGAFGFAIQDRFGFSMAIPVGLFEFGLYGNEVGKKYEFNDLNLKASYTRSFNFSYARDITDLIPQDIFKSISAGINLKMVQGYAYASVDHVTASLITNSDYSIELNNDSQVNIAVSPDFGIEWDFDSTTTKTQNLSPFPSPAGSGFGFDIGFAAELDDVWSFGLALTDIGSITWDGEVVQYTSTGSFILTEPDSTQLDSLSNSFTGDGAYGDPFKSNLPTALRLGTSFRLDKMFDGDFPGEMLIVSDLNIGFNDEPGNSKTPRFSLGFEWKPFAWLPIRSGWSFGGMNGFNWGFGFGFDTGFLDIDLATSDLHSLLSGNSAKRVGIALASRWKF